MKRHVLIYGLIGGLLVAVLKWTEYRFLVVEYSLEIYGGLTAAIFAVLGIWLGRKLGRRSEAARHRAEEERLAQAADAAHEGAKTRHQGGA